MTRARQEETRRERWKEEKLNLLTNINKRTQICRYASRTYFHVFFCAISRVCVFPFHANGSDKSCPNCLAFRSNRAKRRKHMDIRPESYLIWHKDYHISRVNEEFKASKRQNDCMLAHCTSPYIKYKTSKACLPFHCVLLSFFFVRPKNLSLTLLLSVHSFRFFFRVRCCCCWCIGRSIPYAVTFILQSARETIQIGKRCVQISLLWAQRIAINERWKMWKMPICQSRFMHAVYAYIYIQY